MLALLAYPPEIAEKLGFGIFKDTESTSAGRSAEMP